MRVACTLLPRAAPLSSAASGRPWRSRRPCPLRLAAAGAAAGEGAQLPASSAAIASSSAQAASRLDPPPADAAGLLAAVEESLERGGADERLALAALQQAAARRHEPGYFGSAAEVEAVLVGAEQLLRRNLVALTPAQLGLAARWAAGRWRGRGRAGEAQGPCPACAGAGCRSASFLPAQDAPS